MAENRTTTPDPRTQHTRDDFGEQDIPHPGRTDEMDDQPDHGEATYRGSGRLHGRRALITGGDSGIGRAVAIAFAREGADVAIAYLPEEQDDAEETERWIRDAGRTAVLERTYRTNVFAMFWLCRYALAYMQPGSCIINTSSIQGFQPSPHLIDYASTKAAIVNFTKNLAQELAERGVRVNAVAPGPIWTPLIPATMEPEAVATFGQDTPIGRAGQPAELAPAYVFLASPESSYISGEVLGVTGGKPLS